MADALKYLTQRTYSAQELRGRLGRTYGHDEVEDAISRLESTGLVSEQRVIDSLVTKYRDQRAVGDVRLREQMQSLGITPEDVDLIIEKAFAPEAQRASELVRAKYKSPTPAAKIGRFLYSRGFEESTIESVLENLPWAESE